MRILLTYQNRARLGTDDELRQKAATLLRVDAGNYITPREFFERNRQFFCIEPREQYKHRPNDLKLWNSLHHVEIQFKEIPAEKWDAQHLQLAFNSTVEHISGEWFSLRPEIEATKEVKNAVQHFLRWALTGGRPGPTITASMSVLGRDLSLSRIEDATAMFKDMELQPQVKSNRT